jgi:hypothetical protein
MGAGSAVMMNWIEAEFLGFPGVSEKRSGLPYFFGEAEDRLPILLGHDLSKDLVSLAGAQRQYRSLLARPLAAGLPYGHTNFMS